MLTRLDWIFRAALTLATACGCVWMITGCQPGSETVNAGFFHNVVSEEHEGMKYHVYRRTGEDGGIFVVNVTKDKLEVEKLRKELDK